MAGRLGLHTLDLSKFQLLKLSLIKVSTFKYVMVEHNTTALQSHLFLFWRADVLALGLHQRQRQFCWQIHLLPFKGITNLSQQQYKYCLNFLEQHAGTHKPMWVSILLKSTVPLKQHAVAYFPCGSVASCVWMSFMTNNISREIPSSHRHGLCSLGVHRIILQQGNTRVGYAVHLS